MLMFSGLRREGRLIVYDRGTIKQSSTEGIASTLYGSALPLFMGWIRSGVLSYNGFSNWLTRLDLNQRMPTSKAGVLRPDFTTRHYASLL